MSLPGLVKAVEALATAAVKWDEAALGSRAWAWGDYGGLRMALIGSAQDLDDLAADIQQRRVEAGNPPSKAQRLLTEHRELFRDLQALLVGLRLEDLERKPGEDEWAVVEALRHTYGAERAFFASILAGVQAQAEGTEAIPPGSEEQAALTTAAGPMPDGTKTQEVLEAYRILHPAVGQQLSGLTDEQLQARSPFWEPQQPSVQFRIGRLTAHLHEHKVQIEKTLPAIGCQPGEAKLHIRRLYRALAGVEGALLGAQKLEEACGPLAEELTRRVAETTQAVADSPQLLDAIQAGDLATVEAILQRNSPRMSFTTDENGVSALLLAVYHRQQEIVDLLRAGRTDLDLFEAAALGDLSELQEWTGWNPKTANWYAPDGYTPLQLSAFFDQPEAAQFLLEKGADIHALSKNEMGLQAIHAAVAGRNSAIVQALIQAGADVNAQQASGHTPWQAAQQNDDEEIIQLLKEAGAQT